MAEAVTSVPTVCGRCGQRVVTRGGRPPVHCAVCGMRLAPPPGNVEHRFEPAPNVEHRFRRRPVPAWFDNFAVVFGVMSLIPGFGLVFGLTALVLALAAGRRTDEAGRPVGMSSTANSGLLLAVLGLFTQLSCVATCGLPVLRF